MGRAAYSLCLVLAACGPQGGVAEKVDDENGLKEILPPLPSKASPRAEASPPARLVNGPLVATVTGTPEHPDIRGVVRFVPGPAGLTLETSVEGLPAGAHGYHVHMYGDCSDATSKSPGPHLDFASLGQGGQARQQAGTVGNAVVDRVSPPGQVVHPEQPKATADGQLVEHNSTSGVPGGTPGADAADATTRGIGNPHAPGGTTGGAAGTSTTPTAGDPAATPPTGVAAHPGHDQVLGNLGELVAIDGQAATAKTALTQLGGANLDGLLGRAVVIHELPNDPNVPDGAAGTPIACGVIGLANPTPPVTGANRAGSSGPGRTGKQQGTP
jgi:Cu/Zn superoxide dismutase